MRNPAGAEARGIVIELALFILVGGDSGDRTRNLRLAKPALSQLSYIPWGLPRLRRSLLAEAPERSLRWWA